MKDKIILWDLGNTLIYRTKKLINYDTALVKKIFDTPEKKTLAILKEKLKVFPGVYHPWIDGNLITNLHQENQYHKNYFSIVFQELGLNKTKLKEFLKKRNQEIRYNLYKGAENCLKKQKEARTLMGIFTNGRPSRRLIIKRLGIEPYFKPSLIFISDEIGLSKPDSLAFEWVNRFLPKRHQEVILCDDEKINLAAAAKVNWQPVRINHKDKGFAVLNPKN